MAKSYDDLLKSLGEWATSSRAAHTTTTQLSTQTNASQKAKRPSVVQPMQVPFTKAEKKRRGIHGFQLGEK